MKNFNIGVWLLTWLFIFALIFVNVDYSEAQEFDLPIGTSYGFIVNKDLQSEEYTGTIELLPTLNIDKLRLTAVALTYTTNSQTGFLSGMEIGYNVVDKFYLNTSYLLGNTGKSLLSVGTQYDLDQVLLGADVGYEFNDEETWIKFMFAYNLLNN